MTGSVYYGVYAADWPNSTCSETISPSEYSVSSTQPPKLSSPLRDDAFLLWPYKLFAFSSIFTWLWLTRLMGRLHGPAEEAYETAKSILPPAYDHWIGVKLPEELVTENLTLLQENREWENFRETILSTHVILSDLSYDASRWHRFGITE
ncbi:hypothetical protein NP233_g5076 [Leucocoprinus birnbaumii]|uniref:Uncharacterized protein n=1 Tax=Leucocoprinus birnbaumii TaxID=56174 RepID=A0AAD5VTK2_9AGAR|nr:hypothetical protein NP233_g5076 [Leucocoprinus birnbaumii]